MQSSLHTSPHSILMAALEEGARSILQWSWGRAGPGPLEWQLGHSRAAIWLPPASGDMSIFPFPFSSLIHLLLPTVSYPTTLRISFVQQICSLEARQEVCGWCQVFSRLPKAGTCGCSPDFMTQLKEPLSAGWEVVNGVPTPWNFQDWVQFSRSHMALMLVCLWSFPRGKILCMSRAPPSPTLPISVIRINLTLCPHHMPLYLFLCQSYGNLQE